MAEALVSLILEQLASVIRQQRKAEVKLVAGVYDEVQKLTSNFLAIKAVLEDAESRQMREESVADWLDTLKDVSYDMDDVLDEWNTSFMKLQMEEVSEDCAQLKRKVCSLIPCYPFGFRKIVLCRELAYKMKDLNRKLDVIVAEGRLFNFSFAKDKVLETPVPSSSFVDPSCIFGRCDDEDRLLKMLLNNESSHETSIPVISIVGMGGIGKTTVAQLAFNDDKVITHFDTKIWVCVSYPFDEIRIAKEILGSLVGASKLVDQLETVLQEISRFLRGKKFLLVLDDVWNENYYDWENLKYTLKCGSQESRILVTTRNVNVARIIGTTANNMILLGLLSEDESWLLFSRIAFRGRTTEEREKFHDIGEKIVSKCKGLPLALKTLGSLLCFKCRIEEWQIVLGSELWELEEVERGIFPPLLLSYYDLPPRLRRCFLYCAIFPKDYEIEKDKLIKLWMAQGYITDEKTGDMYSIGEEYFENLVGRSFFQDFKGGKFDGSITSCKMHDIVYDFAQFLSKNECFSVEIDSCEGSIVQFSIEKGRHLRVGLKSAHSFPVNIYNAKKLRSLLVGCKNLSGTAVSKLFCECKCLRTLDLSYCGIKILSSEIKKLIQLRYLNLSGNKKIETLPETICELNNLQTLDVSNCYCLQELPHGIGKLINLRYLRNDGTSLSYIPNGIKTLTNLRELRKFVIGKTCKLEWLENLKHLRGFLMITGLGNVKDLNEVNKGKLEDKKKIIGLGLRFDGWMYDEDKGTFEKINPPPNLVELMIEYYIGETMRLNWIIGLTNLRSLKLSSCFEFKKFPPLGRLASLESLYIWKMSSVKIVGNEFLHDETSSSSSAFTAFPKLKSLTIWNMEEWEEWEYGCNFHFAIMPALHSLKLQSCPKLKCLPRHFFDTPPRQKLEITGCPFLEGHYKEKWPKIYHTSDINNSQILGQRDQEEIEDKVSRIPKILVRNDAETSNSKGLFHSEIEEAESD